MLDIIAELEGVVDALEREGVDYAVCGGLALGILGHPRMTKVIDLLVSPDDVDRAVAAVKAIGFDIPAKRMVFRQGKPTEQVTQRISKLDTDTGALLSLDFLLAGDVFASVWESRIRVAYRNREMRVVSAEGLVTMKRLAGRPQDLADIAALEQTDDEAQDRRHVARGGERADRGPAPALSSDALAARREDPGASHPALLTCSGR